jgi:hypothetical protein
MESLGAETWADRCIHALIDAGPAAATTPRPSVTAAEPARAVPR